MDFEGEDFLVENMGFWSSHDFFMSSVLGIEDGFDDMPPFVATCDDLGRYAEPLSPELENQRAEMDLFLRLESNRLRKLIVDEQKRHQAALIFSCESRIRTLVLQKDHELAAARSRARELQERLGSAEVEAAAWEKKATEKEAVVSDLLTRLNRIKNDDAMSSSSSSSAAACCRRGCNSCGGGRLCVVFFPCRHLCCCRACEPLLGSCPVCQTVKEGSVEVYLG